MIMYLTSVRGMIAHLKNDCKRKLNDTKDENF